MDPSIAAALEPPEIGLLLRGTQFLPSVARTVSQIKRYGDHWRAMASWALADESDGSQVPVLVALGDSLAQGIGASNPELGYVGRLRRGMAAEFGKPPPVVNLSRSGARIADVLDVQLLALAALSAEVTIGTIVCTVGSNDLVRSPRLGRACREMDALLESLPGTAIVATVPANGSVAASLFNRRLRSTAEKNQIKVADISVALRSWRGKQAEDRFHPNDAGYEVWSTAFRQQLATPVAA